MQCINKEEENLRYLSKNLKIKTFDLVDHTAKSYI